MSIVAERDAARMKQRPSPDARGLPNHFFTEPDHYRLEQQRLFHRTWVFAGVTASVPAPGSVFQAEVAGVPIFFVRGDDGGLRAFQNVCPHRGARLVCENKTGAKRLTCPYHAWAYYLDGRLASRPYFDGFESGVERSAGDAEDVKLFPVRMETWNGAILVNIDGKAPDLDLYLEALNRETAPYDLAQMRYAKAISTEFDSNWKLTVENWLDSYHVFIVHPTLNKMMIPEQRKAAIGSGTLIYADYFSTESGQEKRSGLPEIPNLTEELANASFFALQFPNWSISIHPAYLLFWHYVPLGVDRTRVDLHFHFVGDAAGDETHAKARTGLIDYYAALNEEDKGICRRMQEGRAAPAYDGGRFSPYWDGGSAWLADLVREAMV